jgi:hypothetical protein
MIDVKKQKEAGTKHNFKKMSGPVLNESTGNILLPLLMGARKQISEIFMISLHGLEAAGS